MSSKKIYTDPISIKKVAKIFNIFLLKFSVLLIILMLFLVFYKFTYRVFSNDYILDIIIKSHMHSRQCLYLDESDPILLKKLDNFYNSIDNKYLVPTIFFNKMPTTSFYKEQDTQIKKSVYINILLPILLDIQKESLKERSKLIEINSRMVNEPLMEEDFIFLDNLASKYKVKLSGNNFWNYVDAIDKLLLKVDAIPNSLALAISAKETGWGTSRFLKEGNSLFSQWAWSTEHGIVPLLRKKTETHVVRKFNNLEDAVRSFYLNINTHPAYSNFRVTRREMRLKEGHLKAKRLVPHLTNYSTEENYTNIINSIITANSLEQFDNYNEFSKKYRVICLSVL